jgi:hypothetical protein
MIDERGMAGQAAEKLYPGQERSAAGAKGRVRELSSGKLSLATKAGAPYLTALFAGRCGKFANLDL